MEAEPSTAPSSASKSSYTEIEQPYVGRWNQLVSTTNWEKGRIIHEWREALVSAAAAAAEFSDDAWSRRVEGITSQHVGRLRRVYHRFASVQALYVGLFWSHFQAALDWDDAEMWLEGAVANRWSVERMRQTRFQTLAAVKGESSTDPSNVETVLDEDFVPAGEIQPSERVSQIERESDRPIPEGPDFGEEDRPLTYDSAPDSERFADTPRDTNTLVQPFNSLAELPPDFADAFDGMKLSILRHKAEGWRQVSCDDVLAALDALKELARTPCVA